MSHPRSILLATAALTLALSACGAPADEEESSATDTSSASPSPTTTPSEAPSDAGTEPAPEPSETEPVGPSITVTVVGDKITPNAEEIDLAVGEPLLMTITSDRAGEFHVHSKPEQYVTFEAGTSTKKLVIETPGVVEAEEHDSGAVVAVITVE